MVSQENLAWTAPVSPQIEARSTANNPRRRNSVRLRELQSLLRAYHEQRETWMQPPERSHSPKKRKGIEQVERQQSGMDKGHIETQSPMAQRKSILSSSPPIPLHYSRAELGIGRPFHFGRFESIKQSPPLVTPKKISLSQLEMDLRGNSKVEQQQNETTDVWLPSNSSSPLSAGQKSSLSKDKNKSGF